MPAKARKASPKLMPELPISSDAAATSRASAISSPARLRCEEEPAVCGRLHDRMRDVIDAEGFRANIGIILIRDNGQVFFARRTNGGWQFPQGGMREGENLEQALYRELREEIGLAKTDVDIVGRTQDWLRYRLPARYVRRGQQPLCIGQKQLWFLLRLTRADARFDLVGSDQPEFDDWRWVDYWEPVREIIYFKRPVYVQALKQLAPLAFPHGAPDLPAWWQDATT
jgi:putative (di)nucleoside polyphosphate hydrolase